MSRLDIGNTILVTAPRIDVDKPSDILNRYVTFHLINDVDYVAFGPGEELDK